MYKQNLLPLSNPYVGPRTFSEDDQERFFGRSQEANDLCSLVLSEQVVLFYAQSGAGKSSLINARLRPDLRNSGFHLLPTTRVSASLSIDDLSNTDNVFVLNLLTWLDESRHPPSTLYQKSLVDYLIMIGLIMPKTAQPEDDQEDELDNADDEILERENVTPILLVIDQLEELFTTHADKWEQRTAFFRQLRTALQSAPYLHLLLVIREDFVASLDLYLRWLPGRLQARYGMERLSAEAAKDAIMGPVAKSEHPFMPGVADKLVDNLRLIRVHGQSELQIGQYVEPVQLQVVCLQLWENLRKRQPGPITDIELEQAGDVDRALSDYYEQSLQYVESHLPGVVSEAVLRNWFSKQLITENDTRGLVNQGDNETGGVPNDAVKILDSERYIVRRESRAGSVWCELTHDRFIQPIVSANHKWESKQNNQLTVMTKLWKDNGYDPARLLTGKQLRDMRRIIREKKIQLTTEETGFLNASILADDHEQDATGRIIEQSKLEQTKRLNEMIEINKLRNSVQMGKQVVILAICLAILSLILMGMFLQQRQALLQAQTTANACIKGS